MGYNYGTTICIDCGKSVQKTGPRTTRCTECLKKHKSTVRSAWDFKKRIEAGDPTVGLGRGGSNKRYKDNPSYKTGRGHFAALRKQMLAETKTCERCGKDLTSVGWHGRVVHHIDHDRNHNDRSNLIVLCKRCHQLEHECWKAFEGATTSAEARSA